MSYQNGMAAIRLEMPGRIPRTEYSADFHWDLVKAVTGIDVNVYSPAEVRDRASAAFRRAWQYDLIWRTSIGGDIFGDTRTRMGHAVYQQYGADYDTRIGSCFSDEEDVLSFDPVEALGLRDKAQLKRDFEAGYKQACENEPDAVNMDGVYVTCISGLLELFGWDLLLTAAGTNPKQFGHVTNRYSQFIQQYFDALAETDIPVIMIHDDMVWTSGAFMKPAWYRKYVFPNIKKQIRPLIDAGKRVLFTADGTFTEFVDDLIDCGFHGFAFEPTTSLSYIAEKCGKTHVIIGNADTRILLYGTKQNIYDEVKRCMDIGRNCPGFFMAVGNHIPPNTPVENALYYNEIYERMSRR